MYVSFLKSRLLQLNIDKFFNQLSDKNQQLATKIENMFIKNRTYTTACIDELPLLTLATLIKQKFYVYGSFTNKMFIIAFLPISEDICKQYDVFPIATVPEATILYGIDTYTLANIICSEPENNYSCQNKQIISDYKELYIDKLLEQANKT